MAAACVTAIVSAAVLIGPTTALWLCVILLAAPLGFQVWEVTCSRRPPHPLPPQQPLSVALVMSAYLPNEAAHVVSVVRSALASIVYAGEWSIVVAYNTPTKIGLEQDLAQLACDEPRLTVLRIPGSSSKADNLNAVIPGLAADVIGIIDADVLLEADVLTRASAWLADGYDFVQGGVRVRQPASFLEKLVAVDVESKHMAAYVGRYERSRITYFAGSNGFWRREVVAPLGFRREAYVEDIDCAVRALLAGRRLAYDWNLGSSELPPANCRGLWNQRRRWAYGWAQLTGDFIVELARSPYLSPTQRWYWLGATGLRRIAAPCALIAGAGVACVTPGFVVVSALGALAGASITASTLQVVSAARQGQLPAQGVHWLVYSCGAPCFEFLRTFVALVALLRQPAWRATPRPQGARS